MGITIIDQRMIIVIRVPHGKVFSFSCPCSFVSICLFICLSKNMTPTTANIVNTIIKTIPQALMDIWVVVSLTGFCSNKFIHRSLLSSNSIHQISIKCNQNFGLVLKI